MALSDRVQERIPAKRLVQLTNGNVSDGTVDTTLLGHAADDVEAFLEIDAGVAYDETDSRLVASAVLGVERLLMRWKGQNENVDSAWEAWRKDIRLNLRRVTGNNRMSPKSSSKLTPTEESPGSVANFRPDIDRHGEVFDDIIPDGS